MTRLPTFRRRLLVLMSSIALVMLSAAGAAASQAGFVYTLVAGSGPNQIFGYSLDPLTGTLAPLPGFPVATGGNGFLSNATELMTYASGRLHVINQTSGTLSVFTVNKATGALTALGSPIAIGVGNGFCIAVHPNGSPVVVGISSSQFASFVVTPTSVTAAPGSPFAAGAADPISCTFSRDGNFVYGGGTGASPNLIAGFSVNAGTGVLTPLAGSPFDAGGSLTRAYAMDSIGRLFLAQFEAVRAFTTPGGVPTAVTGNPFAGLSGVSDGLVHPAGFYILAQATLNQVGVYRIAGSGSATTLSAVGGSPFAAHGTFTNGLALTTDGVLLAANGNSRNLEVFQVDATTGSLMSLFVQPTDTQGISGQLMGLAFAPGTTIGDLNGDARSDVLWRNRTSGQNVGWLMNGLAVSSAANLPAIADTNWDVRGRGDVNGDGRSDVLWRNRGTGQNVGWLMNGLTVSVAFFLPTIADTNWDIQGVGDVDADGKGDVIWRNRMTGQNIGWLMNSTTVSSAAFLPTIADTNWEIKGVGDVNGNARWDVLWRNRMTGQNIVWLMNGLNVDMAAFLPTIADTNWDMVAVGDVNADSKADVLLRNRMTGQNIGWLMNGTVVSVSAFLPTIADTNWEIKGIGDMSVDLMADVVWRNRGTGQNIGWLMNGLTVSSAAFLPSIADTNWEIVGR